MKSILVITAMAVSAASGFAANLNQDGAITAINNHDVHATKDIVGDDCLRTPGYVNAGSYINAGGQITAAGYIYSASYISSGAYISSGTYITAPQVYTAGYLRIGAASTISTGVSLAATIGAAATAPSYSSVAIGRYNSLTAYDGTAASASTWVGKDPLFVLGYGADAATPKNAFAVYKDGTVTMDKAQGDIQMGQFGNP